MDEFRKHDVGIFLTGGETADVGDLVRTVVVDSTVTARIPRAHVVDNANIQVGELSLATVLAALRCV